MKPAQPLERDYYSKATFEKPDGKRFLQNFGRYEPIYKQTHTESARPGEYKPPVKNANTMCKYPPVINRLVQYDYAHRPQLYSLTSQGRQIAASQSNL